RRVQVCDAGADRPEVDAASAEPAFDRDAVGELEQIEAVLPREPCEPERVEARLQLEAAHQRLRFGRHTAETIAQHLERRARVLGTVDRRKTAQDLEPRRGFGDPIEWQERAQAELE